MIDSLKIFILNEKGFAPLDENNFVSYQELSVDTLLLDFITKRLKFFGHHNFQFIHKLDEIGQCDSEFAAVINIVNPFIDPDLLKKMLLRLEKYAYYDMCKSEGAIPGTEPDFLVRIEKWRTKGFEDLACLQIQHDTQLKYNCQLNLRKLKRIKIFKNLVECIDGLERLTIQELMLKLSSNDIFHKIISYFEDVSLVHVSKCPHCGGEIEPIRATVSQPMIGYIPDDKPYYYQCINCKLIMLSPHVTSEESYKLYDKYYKEGQGRDYLVERECGYRHYQSGINMIKSLLPQETRLIDLGSGSGTYIYYIRDHYPYWHIIASDFPQTIEYFNYGDQIETKALDFLKEPIGDNEYDLITAWEVIEHVPFSGFEKLLEKIYAALKPSGIFMFSTPDFDSPLCQAWDFFSLCMPHHIMVFSNSWINNYFSKHPKFKLIGIVNESEIMTYYESWFKYWKSTSKNFETRALAKLFLELLNDEKINQSFMKFLSQKKWGIEMIVAVQKREKED